MNAVLGLKEFVCDLAEQSWTFEGRVRNVVLGLKEFVCDLAEQSWALKAELGMQCWVCVWLSWTELGCEGRVMNAVLGLTEFVCDLISWTELGFEGRVMNTVLGLKEFVFVCDLAEQSWALKAELWM